MTVITGELHKLVPNANWASLPLFDRTGWRRMAFGDFAESIGVRAEPKDAQEEIYVGLEHLDPQCLHIRRWGKGSDVTGTKLRFRKGDIIFGRRRAYQRKLAVAEFGGICSAHAMVVRAKPAMVLPEFLPFLMMSDRFMNRAVEISVGSLSPTINWTTLKLEEFDLPPLDQQRRIAEILWAVDDISSSYFAQHTALDAAIDATRRKVLVGGLHGAKCRQTELGSIPEEWKLVRLSEILTITAGNAFKSETFCETGVQLIRLGNLFNRCLDLSRNPVFLPPEFLEQHSSFLVKPGDILFSMTGTMGKEDYGYAVVVPPNTPHTLLNQRVARLVPGPDILPEYLLHYSWSRLFLDQIYSKAAGSKQANVSNRDIYSTLIPLPSVEEQRAITAKLNELQNAKSSVAAAISCCTTLSTELYRSVF